MCNLKYGTNEPVYKTARLTDMEIRLVVAKGGDGGGRTGNLELLGAKYYIQDGYIRFYSTAEGTVFNIL